MAAWYVGPSMAGFFSAGSFFIASASVQAGSCFLIGVVGWLGGRCACFCFLFLLAVSVFACVVGVLADSFLFVFVCGSRVQCFSSWFLAQAAEAWVLCLGLGHFAIKRLIMSYIC